MFLQTELEMIAELLRLAQSGQLDSAERSEGKKGRREAGIIGETEVADCNLVTNCRESLTVNCPRDRVRLNCCFPPRSFGAT